jgi:hypothetical protein
MAILFKCFINEANYYTTLKQKDSNKHASLNLFLEINQSIDMNEGKSAINHSI